MSYPARPWLTLEFNYAAIQGIRFSNSHNGWMDFTKGQSETVYYPTVDDAFAALIAGDVKFAFIPVANTIAQQVPGVMLLIRDSGVFIIDEYIKQINHCVLGLPGTDITKVHSVLSHKVALGQCQTWLSKHPKMRAVEWYDTAGAAQDVAFAEDKGQIAIAPREAAEGYGLEILVENIQDINPNETRFFVLSKEPFDHPRENGKKFRTAILVQLKNSGRGFWDNHAALTHEFGKRGHRVVESQTFLGKHFTNPTAYFEIEGRVDSSVDSALTHTKSLYTSCSVIGCFPEHHSRVL